jgi:Skp family chaperone for outer membrane proteins
MVSAQLKIGYILSERIRTEYEEFQEAESQLQLEYRKVQFEFDKMVLKMDSLKQDYEVKRLMALDKGVSIRQEIEQMERQIQNYQAEKIGPQGELMRKQAQLEYEILGKVKKAVDKVAIDGGGTNEPSGILDASGINEETGGQTWQNMIDAEAAVMTDHALAGSLAYVTTPSVMATLKGTEKATNTAQFVWSDNAINGYPAVATTQMTADISVFGDFSPSRTCGVWQRSGYRCRSVHACVDRIDARARCALC